MLIHNEISSNEISSYAQGALRYYNIAIGTSDNYDYVVQCFMYQMAFDIMAIEANPQSRSNRSRDKQLGKTS